MSFYKIIKKFDSIISSIEEWIVCFFLIGMLAIVFLGVINRSFFHISISWSEEIARYFMVWGVFVGASLGVKRSVHISVDAFILIIPEYWKKIAEFFGDIIGFIFCAWFFYIGASFIERMIAMGPLSPALRIPMYVAYAAVPFGFGLMSIRYFMKIIYLIFESNGVPCKRSDGSENNKIIYDGDMSK